MAGPPVAGHGPQPRHDAPGPCPNLVAGGWGATLGRGRGPCHGRGRDGPGGGTGRGGGLAVVASYASVSPLLPFLGFGVSAALALVGVAWFFSGGRGWVCALWLLMGGLGHETLLALALVPMAWVVWVDGRRG